MSAKISELFRALDKIDEKEREIADKKRSLLTAAGWKESSSYPGAFWLWSKEFPESKVQWVWRGQEKVPHPGFTINGATLEIALRIEAAWQDVWV